MFTAGFLTLLVIGVLFPNLWYGMHDITDLPVYWGYAARIAQGEAPFTPSFQVEYPPLAVALFRVPGHTGSESLYGIWFNILMGAITVAAGAVTAYTACRLWPRGGRAYVASVLFPVGVALIGTIVINRYDVAVALLIAVFILCITQRWYTAAGVRHRHGLRAQDHPGGAAAAGAAAGRAAAALGLAAGRLRRRGRRAVPALRAQVVGRRLARVPVPPRAAAADRERAGDAAAARAAARRRLGVVGLEPRLALAGRPRRRPRRGHVRRPDPAGGGRRLPVRVAAARAPARRPRPTRRSSSSRSCSRS